MMLKAVLVVGLVCFPLSAAQAQDEPASDVERMVEGGMGQALEARFQGGRTPGELELIARAYRNAAKQAKSDRRDDAYTEAEKRYAKWIEALERSREGEPAQRDTELAGARVECAGMILSQWLAGDLDQFEITNGMRGDRAQLATLLARAGEQYGKALEVLDPLYEDRHVRGDEFLALGIQSTIRQLRLDSLLSLAWTSYYLGVVEPEDEAKRSSSLEQAGRRFQELIDSGEAGQSIFQCYVGLAMAQRQLGRYDDAERSFALARQEGVEPDVEAQVQYELARCHILSGKFPEARTTLAALAGKDVRNLSPEDRPLKYHIYLSKLWDANSYLVEAEALRRQARRSGAGRKAIEQQAQRTRERGLAKMNALRALGGPWPAVVQLYVAASIKVDADPSTLEPAELLALATELSRGGKREEARDLLEEAASRSGVDETVAGDVLFELGKCYYLLKDERKAAETFQRLAASQRGHEKAPQAAGFAYQLWAQLAGKSKRKDDFGRLADALLNLVASYPDHEKRNEAMWGLPVALQSAGRYEEAARQYANVPKDSPNWEKAQFRAVLCERRACDAARGELSGDALATRARSVAAKLISYADVALERAGRASDPDELRAWSGEARVNAAELLALTDVAQFHQALQALEGFEQKYPDGEMTGRVLGARIRAHRGLNQFEEASKILERYLQTVPAEKAGAVLASLAKGMQDEVERLQAEGQAAAASALAGEAVTTFEELVKWCQADPQRAQQAGIVQLGLARMQVAAGQLEQADALIAKLLEVDPKNGNLQRLRARIQTQELTADASPEQVAAAKATWAVLLSDKTMRKRAPEQYWEARYNWLALTLREGDAGLVHNAIDQERVWYPDLGGPPWNERLEALSSEAAEALGLGGESTSPDGEDEQAP